MISIEHTLTCGSAQKRPPIDQWLTQSPDPMCRRIGRPLHDEEDAVPVSLVRSRRD